MEFVREAEGNYDSGAEVAPTLISDLCWSII